jgi:GNAT superfamily N-acetyltransferase
MSEPVRIRPAALDDAGRIATLSAVLGYPVPSGAVEERLERLLGSATDVVLVAELPGDGVVGWIHGVAQDLLEAEQRCEILGLVVDPGARGTGVGRELVTQVEQWAAGRGLRVMTVRSNVVRSESHPFYEHVGYERTKTQHAYRKRLAD